MSAQLTHAQLLNEYDHITRLTYKTVASLLTLQSEKWTDELHYQALRDLNVLHAAVNRIAIPLERLPQDVDLFFSDKFSLEKVDDAVHSLLWWHERAIKVISKKARDAYVAEHPDGEEVPETSMAHSIWYEPYEG